MKSFKDSKVKYAVRMLNENEISKVSGGGTSQDDGPWIEVPTTDPVKKNKKVVPVSE